MIWLVKGYGNKPCDAPQFTFGWQLVTWLEQSGFDSFSNEKSERFIVQTNHKKNNYPLVG
jgi:hypothetical protein